MSRPIMGRPRSGSPRRRRQFGAVVLVNLLLTAITTVAALAGFEPQQQFPVGTSPRSVAVADLNGDGKPDLVTTNASDDTLSVLLNMTPTGATMPTFAAQQTFGDLMNVPSSVAAADLNGDGKPDLAVANAVGNVSVLLNTTTTGASTLTFATERTFTAGASPTSIAAADLNGDGKPDLAVASLHGSVGILRNTTPSGATEPSFAFVVPFVTGASVAWVAVADLNGDGKPDLAVANQLANNVGVLLNTTTTGASVLTFAAQQTFGTGARPGSVAVADLNGDGKLDLATSNFFGDSVSVLLNTTAIGASTPTFATQQSFGGLTDAFTVTAADLNGDGRSDLAIALGTVAGGIRVLLNTTAVGASVPSFAAPHSFGTGLSPSQVAAADLNGDGKPDLAVANDGGNSVSVLLARPADALQFSSATVGVAEGGSAAVTLTRTGSLDGQVTGIVTVAGGTATQGQDFTLTPPQTVTWTDGDGAAKTVTIPITQDLIDEPVETIQLVLTLPGSSFGAMLGAQTTMTVTIADDDTGGVIVTETGGGTAVAEGGATDSFTVVLATQPTENVTIGFATSPAGQLQPLASLTFTSVTWNVAQTITVAAIDDVIVEVPRTATITHTVSSGDPVYNGIVIPPVTVSIADNDVPGVTVSPTSGLVTTEAGGTAQFTVRLNAAPTAAVTIGLSSSNIAKGTISPTSLTFNADATAVNPQAVTVTGVQDTIVDGEVTFAIVTHPAQSTDAAYNGLDPADAVVTIADDDVAGVVTFGAATTQVAENAGSVTITVERRSAGPAGSGASGPGRQESAVPSGSVMPGATATPAASTPGAGPTIHPSALGVVAVTYATANGTANAGQDYVATAGTLTFDVSETTKTITIPILGDAVDELAETLTVALSAPTGGATLGAVSTATVTIADVDTTPCQTTLSAPVPGGSNVLPVISQLGCNVGDTVAIDPGLPNEDRGTILGFGSIVVQQQTTQAHAAGAVVIRLTGGAPTVQNSPGDDDTDEPREETEDERRQRERTNQGGKDDEYIEGNVTETRCDQSWPAVVIANRDGHVEIKLVKEAQAACRSIKVGDYLEADGEKQHEGLFHADSVDVRRRR